MTREEQITQAANEMYSGAEQKHLPMRVGFRTGAKWADKHPSIEQKQQFVDKAWQWIFRVFIITAPLDFQQAIEKEFRKEMNEE